MRARLALVVGGAAVAAAAAYRFLRPVQAPYLPPDDHAEDLRARLAESRVVLEDRDEFEAAETPVDQAEDVPAELGDRRQAVHDRGRHVAEEMRRGSTP